MQPAKYLAQSIMIYLLSWVCLFVFMLFVGDLGGSKSVSNPQSAITWPAALLINVELMLAFGAQHSIMARPWFKRAMGRFVPQFAERSLFVFASLIALLFVMFAWQPLGFVIWNIEWRPLELAVLTGFCAGGILIVWATLEIDHLLFFGVKQCFRAATGRAQRDPPFRARGLYGLVRHPIHLGMLLVLWSAPTMTAGRLLFAGFMTGYLIIGLRLEERDLARALGTIYYRYRERIPMLVPFRRRRHFDRPDATAPDQGVFWGVAVPDPAPVLRLLAIALFVGASATAASIIAPLRLHPDHPIASVATSADRAPATAPVSREEPE